MKAVKWGKSVLYKVRKHLNCPSERREQFHNEHSFQANNFYTSATNSRQRTSQVKKKKVGERELRTPTRWSPANLLNFQQMILPIISTYSPRHHGETDEEIINYTYQGALLNWTSRHPGHRPIWSRGSTHQPEEHAEAAHRFLLPTFQ